MRKSYSLFQNDESFSTSEKPESAWKRKVMVENNRYPLYENWMRKKYKENDGEDVQDKNDGG